MLLEKTRIASQFTVLQRQELLHSSLCYKDKNCFRIASQFTATHKGFTYQSFCNFNFSTPGHTVKFSKGRKGGDQVSYNGYTYTFDRTLKQGSKYWQCLHRHHSVPQCKSRLTTLGHEVVREQPHSHAPGLRVVQYLR